jgi:hypothetical protein
MFQPILNSPRLSHNNLKEMVMLGSPVLHPGKEKFLHCDLAEDGFGYLFLVTRPDGQQVQFTLRDWSCSESTVDWLKSMGYTVQVTALLFDPDEDQINKLLALSEPDPLADYSEEQRDRDHGRNWQEPTTAESLAIRELCNR